jgi:SET domain-containing protein
VISPAVEVVQQDVIHGWGLVAARFIPCGQVIWQLDPDTPVVSCSEVAGWPEKARDTFSYVGYQCSEGYFAICKGIERYMNHCCDPNTWWADSHTLVACKDIQPGQEITYDYATTEIAIAFEMRCTCGSPLCRGKVSNLDYLDRAWQERYGNHLPGYVLRAIWKTGRQG